MTRLHRLIELRSVAFCLAFVTILCWLSGSALAQSDATPALDSAAESTEGSRDRARARTLFLQGQIHYSLGEYDDAIALFRQAYELTGAPGLLFDTAQAYRLKGECSRAVEIYRHFLRLAPASEQAREAEAHVNALATACLGPPMAENGPRQAEVQGDSEPARNGGVDGTPRQLIQRVPPPPPGDRTAGRWSTRMRLRVGLLVAGVATGAITGTLYWWNDSRHRRWRAEDDFLRDFPPKDMNPSGWVDRQDRNDDLLRSIWRVDTVIQVLAVGSGLSVLSAAVLGFLPEHVPVVSFDHSMVRMRWMIPSL